MYLGHPLLTLYSPPQIGDAENFWNINEHCTVAPGKAGRDNSGDEAADSSEEDNGNESNDDRNNASGQAASSGDALSGIRQTLEAHQAEFTSLRGEVRLARLSGFRALSNKLDELYTKAFGLADTPYPTDSTLPASDAQPAPEGLEGAAPGSDWHTLLQDINATMLLARRWAQGGVQLLDDWSFSAVNGRVSRNVLAHQLLSRVLNVPGTYWAELGQDISQAMRAAMYRGYVNAVLPMEDDGEERFAGSICLDVWFCEDSKRDCFTLDDALTFLAPFSAMHLDELEQVRVQLLWSELRARQPGVSRPVDGPVCKALYACLHGYEADPGPTISGRPAQPPPGGDADGGESHRMDQMAADLDAALLAGASCSTLASHALPFELIGSNPVHGWSVVLRPHILKDLEERLAVGVQLSQAVCASADFRPPPLVKLLTHPDKSKRLQFAQFAVRGPQSLAHSDSSYSPLVGRWHIVQFMHRQGYHTWSCTCLHHGSSKNRLYRRGTPPCSELALLCTLERARHPALLDDAAVLRECLQRSGYLMDAADESAADSIDTEAAGQVDTQQARQDQANITPLRLGALWRAVAHPLPSNLVDWKLPSKYGTFSVYGLAQVLDEGEAAAQRMAVAAGSSAYAHGRMQDQCMQCSGSGTRQPTADMLYTVVGEHQRELVVDEPGKLAKEDTRSRWVQWAWRWDGQLAAYHAEWQHILCMPALLTGRTCCSWGHVWRSPRLSHACLIAPLAPLVFTRPDFPLSTSMHGHNSHAPPPLSLCGCAADVPLMYGALLTACCGSPGELRGLSGLLESVLTALINALDVEEDEGGVDEDEGGVDEEADAVDSKSSELQPGAEAVLVGCGPLLSGKMVRLANATEDPGMWHLVSGSGDGCDRPIPAQHLRLVPPQPPGDAGKCDTTVAYLQKSPKAAAAAWQDLLLSFQGTDLTQDVHACYTKRLALARYAFPSPSMRNTMRDVAVASLPEPVAVWLLQHEDAVFHTVREPAAAQAHLEAAGITAASHTLQERRGCTPTDVRIQFGEFSASVKPGVSVSWHGALAFLQAARCSKRALRNDTDARPKGHSACSFCRGPCDVECDECEDGSHPVEGDKITYCSRQCKESHWPYLQLGRRASPQGGPRVTPSAAEQGIQVEDSRSAGSTGPRFTHVAELRCDTLVCPLCANDGGLASRQGTSMTSRHEFCTLLTPSAARVARSEYRRCKRCRVEYGPHNVQSTLGVLVFHRCAQMGFALPYPKTLGPAHPTVPLLRGKPGPQLPSRPVHRVSPRRVAFSIPMMQTVKTNVLTGKMGLQTAVECAMPPCGGGAGRIQLTTKERTSLAKEAARAVLAFLALQLILDPLMCKAGCMTCSCAPVGEVTAASPPPPFLWMVHTFPARPQVLDGNMKDVNHFASALVDWSAGLDDDEGSDDDDSAEQLLPPQDPHWPGTADGRRTWTAPGGLWCAEWECLPYLVDLIIAGTYGRQHATVRFWPRPKHFPAWVLHSNRPEHQKVMSFGSGRGIKHISAKIKNLVRADLTLQAWSLLCANPQSDVPGGRVAGCPDKLVESLICWLERPSKQGNDQGTGCSSSRAHGQPQLQTYVDSLRRLTTQEKKAFIAEMNAVFSADPQSCHKTEETSQELGGPLFASTCLCKDAVGISECQPRQTSRDTCLPTSSSVPATSGYQQLGQRERTRNVLLMAVQNRRVRGNVVVYDGGCQAAVRHISSNLTTHP